MGKGATLLVEAEALSALEDHAPGSREDGNVDEGGPLQRAVRHGEEGVDDGVAA